MANRWIKCNLLMGCCVLSWIIALSPIAKIARGFCYGIAIVSAVKVIQESDALMHEMVTEKAIDLMNLELQQTEIALHTYQQEQKLHATYSTEVREEINQSLEHLIKNEVAEHPLTTSTSTNELKEAINALLEAGKSQTFIIENVLGCRGRKFDEGKQRLQQILGDEV